MSHRELELSDKEIISQVHNIHKAYETRIYGSEITETAPISEADAWKQAKAVYRMYYSGTIGGGLVYTYGLIDGYNIISLTTSEVTNEPTIIGTEHFDHYLELVFFIYQDGSFVNLEELYKQGVLSDETLAKLAEKHNSLWEEEKQQKKNPF